MAYKSIPRKELEELVVKQLIPLYKGHDIDSLKEYIRNNDDAYLELLNYLMAPENKTNGVSDTEISDLLRQHLLSGDNVFSRIVLDLPNHIDIEVNEEPPFERKYKWSDDPLRIGGPARALYKNALSNVGCPSSIDGKVTFTSILNDEEYVGKSWDANLHDANKEIIGDISCQK